MKIQIGDVFYNPKGKYRLVIVGRTIKQNIEACKWYAMREGGMSISCIWSHQLDTCTYLGKTKVNLQDLYECGSKRTPKKELESAQRDGWFNGLKFSLLTLKTSDTLKDALEHIEWAIDFGHKVNL